MLQAIINQEGRVVGVSVLSSTTPNLGFEQVAIDAVKQWRYEPARLNGRPVDVYFNIVVEFSIR